MPGDATHVKSAKWMCVIAGIILYAAGIELLHIIAMMLLFMFGVMFLSPDLDLPKTAPIQRWGGLKILWAPFEKKIAHRSKWSHGLILGYITIHVYFLVILALAILFLRLAWLPLIEPMIAMGNDIIDDIISLNFTPELVAAMTAIFLVSLAYHWHHCILDKYMKN